MDETVDRQKTLAAQRKVVGAVRWLQAAWAMLGIFLAFLTLLEACLAVYYDHVDKKELATAAESAVNSGVYREANWAAEYFNEVFAYETPRWYAWAPYTYTRVPVYEGKYIHVSQDGSRRTWNPKSLGTSAKPRIRIFFFGGSTLWGYGSRDEFTIPSDVSKDLARAGLSATVTNFAVNADVSTQSMIRFISQLRDNNAPDLVVFYGGLVDSISACLDKRAGIPLGSSYFATEFTEQKLTARVKPDNFALTRLIFGRQKPEGCAKDLGELSDGALNAYLTNVRFLKELSRRFSFKVLFYFEPQLSDKAHRTKYEEAKFQESKTALPGLNELYTLTRDKLIQGEYRLFGEAAVNDLRGVFAEIEGPIYLDDGHYGEEGNERISLEIANDILTLYSPTN